MRLVFVLLLAATGGCATVYAPAWPADATPFYLARYNVHSSIALPSGDGFVEYSLGDWNYAALHHKQINDALGALTIGGEAALERRLLRRDRITGEPVYPDGPDSITRLYASKRAVDARLAELNFRFHRDARIHASDGVVTDADNDAIYVKDPEHYWVENNCNDLTVETFRALGYRVDGFMGISSFRIVGDGEPPNTAMVGATVTPLKEEPADP